MNSLHQLSASQRILAAVAILATGLLGQTTQFSLTTTFAAGNGQSGNMFDLEATGGSPLVIRSFDVNSASVGTIIVNVYVVTAGTTFVGNETVAANWTLLGSVTATATAINVGTPLNLNANYTLNPGGRVGFYVVRTDAGILNYTNGTLAGNVFATDPRLTFYEGVGSAYPFGGTFSPRVWNGIIRYDLGENLLALSQSGPSVGDLTVSLTMINALAFEGFIVLTSDTNSPVGTGWFLGINPDPFTFNTLTYPYFAGNPFHFRTADVGVFPQVSFVAGPGSLSQLANFSFDFVTILLRADGLYAGRSNIVRITFQ